MNAVATPRSPATGRARIIAWRSHTRAQSVKYRR